MLPFVKLKFGLRKSGKVYQTIGGSAGCHASYAAIAQALNEVYGRAALPQNAYRVQLENYLTMS